VTKWVHLNGGDAAVCMLFRKIHAALKPGGKCALVTAPWESYARAVARVPVLEGVYRCLSMRPHDFQRYCIERVGFKAVVKTGSFARQGSGTMRVMWVLEK